MAWQVLQAAGELFSDGVVLGNNADFPGVNGRMIESFGSDFQHGWGGLLEDIALLQREAAMGTFLEVHGESRAGLGPPSPPGEPARLRAIVAFHRPFSYTDRAVLQG